MQTCAEFGGKNADGTPCGRRVVDARCRDHSATADEQMADTKARFLELFAGGDKSLRQVSRSLSIGNTTLWRWRQQDPDFDKAISELVPVVEAHQVAEVERTLFERAKASDGSPTDRVFFLCNRAPDRWRHVQNIRLTGSNDGPIRTTNIDVDPADLSDAELQRIAGGEDPLKVLTETRSARRQPEAAAEPAAPVET